MAKSWDIKPRSVPQRPQPAAARPAPRRVADITPAAMPTRRDGGRRAASLPKTPLRKQRRSRRRRFVFIFLAVLLALFVGTVVILWQPFLRVSSVEAEGPDSDALKTFVEADLSGTRYGILPKNSIFFIPQAQIRANILKKFPDIEAVSIAPAALNTLSVKSVPRAAVLWWCGEAYASATSTGQCLETDATGFIFAAVPLDERYATDSMLALYGALEKPPAASGSAIGDTIKNAAALPALIQFVKAMKALNANVVAVDMRSDEADLYTAAGTRITYVLGHEEQAAALAATAFPTLNLNDGSLLYVDLRFDGKVFYKKK